MISEGLPIHGTKRYSDHIGHRGVHEHWGRTKVHTGGRLTCMAWAAKAKLIVIAPPRSFASSKNSKTILCKCALKPRFQAPIGRQQA